MKGPLEGGPLGKQTRRRCLLLRLDLAAAFALFAVVAGLGGLDAAFVSAFLAFALCLGAATGGLGHDSVIFLFFSLNSGGDKSGNREGEN